MLLGVGVHYTTIGRYTDGALAGFITFRRGDYVFARAMEGGCEDTDVLQLFLPAPCVIS